MGQYRALTGDYRVPKQPGEYGDNLYWLWRDDWGVWIYDKAVEDPAEGPEGWGWRRVHEDEKYIYWRQ